MTLVPGYLDYPNRRRGLDQDRYTHRYLRDAPAIVWPGEARVALCISVSIEFFPMDMPRAPLLPPGGMNRPGPSFWDYTLRDYGNRIGIYRIMKALDAVDARATAATNAHIAVRYPLLLRQMLDRNWEIAACGVDMGLLHHGGVPQDQERKQVHDAFDILRRESGQPVEGWFSPAASESLHTPDLVAQAGATYLSDWCNDDAPYWMNAAGGSIVSLPLAFELSDRRFLFAQNQPLQEWEAQVIEAVDVLEEEAGEHGGRMFSLSLAPWIIGQPYRIAALERVLAALVSRKGIWVATASEIAAAWREQKAPA